MFIKNLVMWRIYNFVLKNSDITRRPSQRLAISDNLNRLSAYLIWNILVLNIKGKINKIAIMVFIVISSFDSQFIVPEIYTNLEEDYLSFNLMKSIWC